MFESLFSTATTTSTSTSISVIQVILTILVAFAVGSIISGTYVKTYPSKNYSQNFALTMVLLPAVIAVIIMLIGNDIAKAFSLAGAFSIVRFRSAPGEPKDIVFVLFAMAAGLATGVGVFAYAIVFTVIMCFVMYVLSHLVYNSAKIITKELSITVPEDLDYQTAFDDIFKNYTNTSELKKVKTSAMGSLYQLTYNIEINENTDIKGFMDALRCRNGNLTISLNMLPDTGGY